MIIKSLDINYCDDNPCLNGATCNDLPTEFTCDCVLGFEGDTCQTGKFIYRLTKKYIIIIYIL